MTIPFIILSFRVSAKQPDPARSTAFDGHSPVVSIHATSLGALVIASSPRAHSITTRRSRKTGLLVAQASESYFVVLFSL